MTTTDKLTQHAGHDAERVAAAFYAVGPRLLDQHYADPEDPDAIEVEPRSSLLEWGAAAAGAAGSLLLAIAVHPAYGFALFAVSNVGWIAVSLRRGLRALLVQQIVFTVTTMVGLWNWWLGPLLLG